MRIRNGKVLGQRLVLLFSTNFNVINYGRKNGIHIPYEKEDVKKA